MKFTKMHGIGNDYVYVNGFETSVEDPSAMAIAVSNRHFAIGSDGLILILPSVAADVTMRMFNADGSEGRMCGNGIRCVAKYAYDHGLAKVNPIRVETLSGIKTIDLTLAEDGTVATACVDMGEPMLSPAQIPTTLAGDTIIDQPLNVDGCEWRVTCVSMGNPHAVVFVDDVAALDLEAIGPGLETHSVFPEAINVHFVEVHSPAEVTMRTWERGSGITQACGTGASAVCVAGVLTGRNDRCTLVHLPGGDLAITWQENNHVLMDGPAAEVYSGEWPGKE